MVKKTDTLAILMTIIIIMIHLGLKNGFQCEYNEYSQERNRSQFFQIRESEARPGCLPEEYSVF